MKVSNKKIEEIREEVLERKRKRFKKQVQKYLKKLTEEGILEVDDA